MKAKYIEALSCSGKNSIQNAALSQFLVIRDCQICSEYIIYQIFVRVYNLLIFNTTVKNVYACVKKIPIFLSVTVLRCVNVCIPRIERNIINCIETFRVENKVSNTPHPV